MNSNWAANWISVKDRLPESNQSFWAHRQSCTFPVTIMIAGAALPSDYFAFRQEITHWMPATLLCVAVALGSLAWAINVIKTHDEPQKAEATP